MDELETFAACLSSDVRICRGMATREEHEAGLAMFVTAARRDRFRDSLQNPRMREKLRRELAHFEHRLDPRFATLHHQSTKHDAHEVEVHRLLLNAGAPATCFVLTDERASDQGELPLRAAVEQLMWVGAGFLSCIPGRLGIYVSEDGSNVFLLSRTS